MRRLSAFIAVGFLWLCTGAEAYGGTSCKMISETTLSIRGSITAELLPCVEALDLSDLQTMILDTQGGDVDTALSIGDIIAPYTPHMIIKTECNSSCANYWLPLARKITFTKKAYVILHGSIDPGLVAKTEFETAEDENRVKNTAARQEDYRFRHKIPRGWLMYRTEYEKGLDAFEPWLTGRADVPELKGLGKLRVTGFMITKPMFESCLPGIPLEAYDVGDAGRASARRWRKLAKQGILSSGTMVCADNPITRN